MWALLALALTPGCGPPPLACSASESTSLCVDEPVLVSPFPTGTVISSADMNGNGGTDLIVGVDDGETSVVLFDGREPIVVPLGEATGGASAGDLDGDGIAEVLTHAPGVMIVHDLQTLPATTTDVVLPFSATSVTTTVLERTWGVSVVFAGFWSGFLAVLDLSGAEPTVEYPLIGHPYYFSRPMVGDYDGDGEPDLAASVINSAGGMTYLSTKGYKSVRFVRGHSRIARDLDGDGRDELVTSTGSVVTLGRYNWEELPELDGAVSPTRDDPCPILVAGGDDGDGPLALAEFIDGAWTMMPYLRSWDDLTPHYLGDFDGDRRCDVLLTDHDGNNWIAWGR